MVLRRVNKVIGLRRPKRSTSLLAELKKLREEWGTPPLYPHWNIQPGSWEIPDNQPWNNKEEEK